MDELGLNSAPSGFKITCFCFQNTLTPSHFSPLPLLSLCPATATSHLDHCSSFFPGCPDCVLSTTLHPVVCSQPSSPRDAKSFLCSKLFCGSHHTPCKSPNPQPGIQTPYVPLLSSSLVICPFALLTSVTWASLLFLNHIRNASTPGPLHWLFPLPGVLFLRYAHRPVSCLCSDVPSLIRL